MAILLPADYPSVRALLDVSYVEQAWPSDAVIELRPFAPAAERTLTEWAPEAVASSDPATQQAVLDAAIYLTAAYLAPAIPRLHSESEAGYQYTIESTDWAERAASLTGQAAAIMRPYIPASSAGSRQYTHFRLAPAYPRW